MSLTKPIATDIEIKLDSKKMIVSKTDVTGKIIYGNDYFCEISGYKESELVSSPHSILRHPDMPDKTFEDMWKTIKANKTWEGEVKNLRKDGSFYWVHSFISPKCTEEGASCGYTAIRYDITDKKAVEDLTSNLEIKIKERTLELETEKENVEQILANISLPVLITSVEKGTIVYANKFAQELYEKTNDEITGIKLDNLYSLTNGSEAFNNELATNGKITSLEEHITTHSGKEFTALLSVTPISYNGKNCYIVMTVDITDQKKMENEVRAAHKRTRESIEYAALIQSTILPDNNNIREYFKDHFVIWHPKDTVGGDIYFFEQLRDKDECLLFVIDCTGHGVPGAFVTMLVKAVEQQIIAHIMNDNTNMDISPAWIMQYFNKELKKLLKQETKGSIYNAGWDGGIIYYNRKEQIIKFAGAETPLFYITKDGEFKTIKGNRYSVGYNKCSMDYEYKETIIEVEEGMKFYCTTDGYLDQNGGEKDFPLGKKRFGNIIKEYHSEPMAEQQEIFLYKMMEWEEQIEDNDRNDDITVIGFEIGAKADFVEDLDDSIVKYEGIMTQNIIGRCIDNIEAKISNINIMSTISTITIEFCQNIMHYSKNNEEGSRDIVPAGSIEVKYVNQSYYEITATNIISIDDKKKIEPILKDLTTLDKAEIKKRYKELRKSGKNTHKKGGGIGMYEIAKASTSLDFYFKAIYNFQQINNDKYYFTIKSTVQPKA